MSINTQNRRIIFGLRVKQLRQAKGLSFQELSKASGVSVSYLNEIEKGKKYPKEDRIAQLAKALGVSHKSLTSAELGSGLGPVADLLRSNFLNELPLDLFGIDLQKIVSIIANAPARVGAFISTLVEISRNYELGEENFYVGAMRAYQELHLNHFPELEEQADKCARQHGLPTDSAPTREQLQQILVQHYHYELDYDSLQHYPELRHLRCVYLPKPRKLLINRAILDQQEVFLLAREVGFNFLQLEGRPLTAPLHRLQSFEPVLSNFKASYLAAALMVKRDALVADLRVLFSRAQWDASAFLGLMSRYKASPEMFFQRLTNVLPEDFGIKQLFFLRIGNKPGTDHFAITKEMHLGRQHYPHRSGLSEHYCRRWNSTELLKHLPQLPPGAATEQPIVGIQRSRFHGTGEEYLSLTFAKTAYPLVEQNVSITLGLLIDDHLRAQVGFTDDNGIPYREVNQTCERCSIMDCEVRAALPSVILKRQQRQLMQKTLKELWQE